MRAVVDNNLFVSGLLWGDKLGRLFNMVVADKDLLSLKSFHGIPILTAREALEKLGILP